MNEETKQIRRLSGNAEPTPRIGADGEWQDYAAVLPCEAGLVMSWPWINPDGSFPLTITSPIVAMREVPLIETSSTEEPGA